MSESQNRLTEQKKARSKITKTAEELLHALVLGHSVGNIMYKSDREVGACFRLAEQFHALRIKYEKTGVIE